MSDDPETAAADDPETATADDPETATADESESAADGEPYRGAPGAFPYAFRQSDSWSFRFYWIVATLVAAFVVVTFGAALVVLISETRNQSASVTLVRAFYVLVTLAVVLPIVAPILLVARRHRLDLPVHPAYDRGLAVAGMGFIAALYFGLIVSAPGRLVPDSLGWLGVVPPLLGAAGIWVMHRRLRTDPGGDTSDSDEADDE